MTPNIDCYRVGPVPNELHLSRGVLSSPISRKRFSSFWVWIFFRANTAVLSSNANTYHYGLGWMSAVGSQCIENGLCEFMLMRVEVCINDTINTGSSILM